jgi:hypothetical protein
VHHHWPASAADRYLDGLCRALAQTVAAICGCVVGAMIVLAVAAAWGAAWCYRQWQDTGERAFLLLGLCVSMIALGSAGLAFGQ